MLPYFIVSIETPGTTIKASSSFLDPRIPLLSVPQMLAIISNSKICVAFVRFQILTADPTKMDWNWFKPEESLILFK